MTKIFSISKDQVVENIRNLCTFMDENNLEGMYISSYDCFLNEYVPIEECHRYYFTHFTGSVAEVLATKNGDIHLFVDGRYYEQADQEVDNPRVIVEKVPYGVGLKKALEDKVEEFGFKNIGIEGDRCPSAFKQSLSGVTSVISFNQNELKKRVEFSSHKEEATLEQVDLKFVGLPASLKLNMILNEGEAMLISALDSISWLTNMRGYQLPFQSSFKAKCLAFKEGLYLVVDSKTTVPNCDGIEVIVDDNYSIASSIEEISKKYKVECFKFDPSSVNAADYDILINAFGEEKMKENKGGLVPYHSIKNQNEISAMQDSFALADKAIVETIKWTKNAVLEGQKLSELDFYNKTNEIYKSHGAKAQSFKTISAVGANASVMHFSSPSADTPVVENEMLLLDSGAYFESGYATDTTRTFLVGTSPSAKQIEIYTLVLKGLLQSQNAIFPDGTWGCAIDSLARMGMRQMGYDYAHGTGHGVGINVHEGGFRASPTSNTPILENVAGSLEPGIYLPGFGGVRLENIVITEKHPKFKGMLRFKSFVYIGYDHDLIDRSLLTKDEEFWLDEYEEECKKRGTSFLN